MGRIRTGTVGYNYREWIGSFYPMGTQARRQLQLYSEQFDICELTQFAHQMPEAERMGRLAAQLKSDIQFYVRIHNTFTQCADVGLALSLAKHFRRAMEPLFEAGKLAGLVAPFPYAFKNTPDRREYIEELAARIGFQGLPLQLDFRHGSWMTEESIQWMRDRGLGLVLVDEPPLPNLVPPLAVATTERVLVRFHGRNADAWWSGNQATRYDYDYSEAELEECQSRYAPLIRHVGEVNFLFQNNWEAHSVRNATEWRSMVSRWADQGSDSGFEAIIPPEGGYTAEADAEGQDDDARRPPTTLSLAEVKSRVNQALSPLQGVFQLPPKSGV